MVSLHFSSYSITLLQIQTLPLFPSLSCLRVKRKLTTENRGPVPTGPKRSTYLQLYQMLPTDVVPEYQAKKKHGLSNCKENEKKAEQKKRKQKKRQGGKVISSWKLGHKFGRRCSVYMTSCIVTHYLLLLDAERLRPALRNGK